MIEPEGIEEEPLPSASDILNRWTWVDRGACKGKDTSLWFSEERGDIAAAVVICRSCPVRAICAEYAVLNGEEYGVWGGLTDAQIRRIRFDRGLAITDRRARGANPVKVLPETPPPTMPALVDRNVLAEAWGVSTTLVTNAVKDGRLPPPVAKSGRSPLYDRDAMWAARREMMMTRRRRRTLDLEQAS